MAQRVTQAPVEAALGPTSQKARVTQAATEAVLSPTSQKARVTQCAVEVVIKGVITEEVETGGTLSFIGSIAIPPTLGRL